MKLEIFDPKMCCSSGTCGDNADSRLVEFALDLDWLQEHGVEVVRYGLAFDPIKFKENKIVNEIIASDGEASLPIILADGRLVSKAVYLPRKHLAMICNLKYLLQEENPDAKVNQPAEAKNLKNNFEDTINRDGENACNDAPVEDNCYKNFDCDCEKSFFERNLKKILFVFAVLIIFALVFFRTCCSVAPLAMFFKH